MMHQETATKRQGPAQPAPTSAAAEPSRPPDAVRPGAPRRLLALFGAVLALTACGGAADTATPDRSGSRIDGLEHAGRSGGDWLEELRDGDAPSDRAAAAAAVGALAIDAEGALEPLVDALVVALADNHPLVRNAALRALVDLGPTAVPQLLATLGGDRPAVVRAGVAVALGRIGPADRRVLPALIGAIRDREARVRRAAVTGLSASGAAESAIPALITALDDEEIEVAEQAAGVLGSFGPAAAAAVPALQRAAAADDARLRAAAETALQRIQKPRPAPRSRR